MAKKRKPTSFVPYEFAPWLDVLNSVPAGQFIVQQALQNGVRFRLTPQSRQYAYYQKFDAIIGVKPSRHDHEIIGNLAHELRHAFQDSQQTLENLSDSPADALLRARCTEADAESFALLVCAQLAEAGHPEYLKARLNGEMGDIAQVFVKALPQGPLVAMRAAYNQWFKNPDRCDSYFQDTLFWMETNLEDRTKAQYKAGSKPYTHEQIALLGILPDKMNYLNGQSDIPLDDAFYCQFITAEQKQSLIEAKHTLTQEIRHLKKRKRNNRPTPKP